MEKWRVSEIYNEAGLRLLAVFATEFHYDFNNATSAFGTLKPIAVIVCREGDVYALDTEAGKISLEDLTKQLPELVGLIRNNQC